MRLLLILLLLTACKSIPPSEAIANSAVESVVAIENSLSKECKTKGINTQLVSIKSQISTISKACDVEKDVLNKKITIRNIIIGILFALIILLLVKKVA